MTHMAIGFSASADSLSTDGASAAFEGVELLPERIHRSNLALNVTAYCACRA